MNRFIKHGRKTGLLMSLALVLAVFAIMALPQSATAATTELTITKYVYDGSAILDQLTVDYHWLMDENNIEVMGDGTTRYYHQGPVFKDHDDEETQKLIRWNPEEDHNWDTKDMGAVKGNNVVDLCNLVGGMAAGDKIEIKASDGFKKEFAYKNVYQYSNREGPMVVCWYKDGKYPDTGYDDGMRLVWFADNLINPKGYHVFGNWDWHIAADKEYWYYWYDGSERYPTTTGLSVQKVSQINIYSNETAIKPPALTADTEDNKVGWPVDITITDGGEWWKDITCITVDGRALNCGQYSISGGKISINASVFTQPGEYEVVVRARGYSPATVTQTMEKAQWDILFNGAVALAADKNFEVTISDGKYTVKENTPLGALHKAATAGDFTYDLTDKKYVESGVLLLNNVANYNYVKQGSEWYAYVNGAFKDGFTNADDALNLIELVDGDKVEFYYADVGGTELDAVKAAATAAVLTVVDSDATTPSVGWTLEMVGEIGDTITQEEFEDGLACIGSGHYQEWTDDEGKVWSGVPLWVLVGTVDDIENSSHWTFNDTLAASYDVKVIAADGEYFRTFDGADVANSNGYIVANKYDGQPLTGNSAPLRLVGDGVTKDDGSLGGSAVGNIARIEIPELQTPPAAEGSWNLSLKGKITDVMSQEELEEGIYCPNSGHLLEWTDGNGDKWSGMPLRLLAGWVDDRKPHSYDFVQASAGYKIVIKAEDGHSVDFDSKNINKSDDYIVANKLNGLPLADSWPLRLVGPGVATEAGFLTGKSVGSIVEIKLTSFETGDSGVIPDLHIVKYGEDGVTIIDEFTINYSEMQQRFDVIGDGTTVYKYQGITNNADDIWSAEDETVGGFKIENAIMGTRVSDLVSLVGGMGTGTDIIFVAKDGWETTLPYSSIYPDPSVYARQGDAVIAWHADGKYVPDYKDGMRLFFTPEDKIYSQWDMHETLAEPYWHYYYGDVMYPSCAGLSPKYITEIKVYSVPQGDWTLELDGLDIGGLKKDISKTYFESALTCTMGANHKATYTDSEDQTWEGMPLWLLAGFVDDADQHSDNAFNNELATTGYQVVITAQDGYSVIINSADIIRNNDYIVANSLDGATIPIDDKNWPLRVVGPKVSGKSSISQIVSIELVSPGAYTVSPVDDPAYAVGKTDDGISTMTVNSGVSGSQEFTVQVQPETPHTGQETVVFTHLRNGVQLQVHSTKADFDEVNTAQARFNVQPGDVIKVYIGTQLTNDKDYNPTILQ